MITSDMVETLVMALGEEFSETMQVQSYPNQIDEEYELLHPNGALLVRWDGQSEVQRNIANTFTSDLFEISILSRTLNAESTGIYDLFDNIKTVIREIEAEGRPFYCISCQLTAYYIASQVWHYSMKVMSPNIEYN